MTVADLAEAPSGLDVRVIETAELRALRVDLGGPHDVVSWAIVNGGRTRAETVVWREVRLTELGPAVDAAALTRRTLAVLGTPGAIGLLTARDVRRYEVESATCDGVTATCVATVGLGNLLAVGDAPMGTAREAAGTINVLCRLSVGLTEEALLEASAMVAEARTAAVLAAALPSPVSGRPATGTGTDCLVVAAPVMTDARARGCYAGKHTAIGAALGSAVTGAVGRGVARWLKENRCPTP